MEDATWEGEHILQHPGLMLLEDKQSRERRFPRVGQRGVT
jgi:hypothetical protein